MTDSFYPLGSGAASDVGRSSGEATPDGGRALLVEAALGYRGRGWAPIAVASREKNPNRPGWQNERLDEAAIVRIWSGRPRNIGIVLGEPSGGLVDIDLDAPEAVRLAPLFLPPTEAVFGRTGKPRSHWLYQVSPPPRTQQWAGLGARVSGFGPGAPLEPGLDAHGSAKPTPDNGHSRALGTAPEGTVAARPRPETRDPRPAMLVELRGTGAQTIFPPSIHPTGQPYIWAKEGTPAVVDGERLRLAAGRLAVATLLARNWPGQGSRHQTSLAVAGGLLARGWEVEQVMRLVGAVATLAGDEEVAERVRSVETTAGKLQRGERVTGLPALAELLGKEVVDHIFAWTGAKIVPTRGFATSTTSATPSADVWEAPIPFNDVELPSFPVDCLPSWQARFIDALARATQTPCDLAAMLVLGATAAAVARRVELLVQPGWTEPLNIYTVTALPSGNRKSAVLAAVIAPLEAFEEEEVRDSEALIRAAQTRHTIAEQALRRAQAEAAKASSAEREGLQQEAEELAQQLLHCKIPARPRLLADDATPERLASLLAEQGGRMAVISPEGDVFDLMAGRYSSTASANFGVYLKGHAGDPLRIDRVGRASEYVKRPALTLAISPQPSIIEGLAGKAEFRERGLLARFWYSLPESLVGRRQTAAPPVPRPIQQAYEVGMGRLLRVPPGQDLFGRPDVWPLHLEPSALARLLEFSAWLEPQLAEFGALGALPDWGSKLSGAVARCAGLLHLAEMAQQQPRPWETPIARATLERAIRIGEYLIPHAGAAFASMGADPRVNDARYLLRWLQQRYRTDDASGDSTNAIILSKRECFEGTKSHFKRVELMDPGLQLLIRHGYLRELVNEERSGNGRPPSPRYELNPQSPSQKS
ncbi:MAG: DUF3987 domain-containing protein [Dehalococcoidia bacterium]